MKREPTKTTHHQPTNQPPKGEGVGWSVGLLQPIANSALNLTWTEA